MFVKKHFPTKILFVNTDGMFIKNLAYLFVLECNVCHKIEHWVSEMEKHFHENHGTQLEKMCVHCAVGYDDPEEFYKHLIEKHDVPTPADSRRQTTNTISSVIDGALKVYQIDLEKTTWCSSWST